MQRHPSRGQNFYRENLGPALYPKKACHERIVARLAAFSYAEHRGLAEDWSHDVFLLGSGQQRGRARLSDVPQRL